MGMIVPLAMRPVRGSPGFTYILFQRPRNENGTGGRHRRQAGSRLAVANSRPRTAADCKSPKGTPLTNRLLPFTARVCLIILDLHVRARLRSHQHVAREAVAADGQALDALGRDAAPLKKVALDADVPMHRLV